MSLEVGRSDGNELRSRITTEARPASVPCVRYSGTRVGASLVASGSDGPRVAQLRQRKFADALAGRGEDRVRDRRQDRRQGGLAEPGRRVVALQEMSLDGRGRLGDTQRGVLVKVALHRPSSVERDLESHQLA